MMNQTNYEKVQVVGTLPELSTNNQTTYLLSNGNHRVVVKPSAQMLDGKAKPPLFTTEVGLSFMTYQMKFDTETEVGVTTGNTGTVTISPAKANIDASGFGIRITFYNWEPQKGIYRAELRFKQTQGDPNDILYVYRRNNGSWFNYLDEPHIGLFDIEQDDTEVLWRKMDILDEVNNTTSGNIYYVAMPFMEQYYPTEIDVSTLEFVYEYAPMHKMTDPNPVETSIACGDACVVKANLYTGETKLKMHLADCKGVRSPMSVGAVWSAEHRYKTTIGDSFINVGFPAGWKLNYHQVIYLYEGQYHYVDADYNTHIFTLAENTGAYYYDTCGTGLILKVLENGEYIITSDNAPDVLHFNQAGYLIRISHYQGGAGDNVDDATSNISMTYSGQGMVLTKITDGVGNTVDISYSYSEIRLTFSSGGVVVFEKDANNVYVTKIHQRDETSYQFIYENEYLTRVTAPTIESLALEFTPTGKLRRYMPGRYASALLTNDCVYDIQYCNGCTYVHKKRSENASHTQSVCYMYNTNGKLVTSYELKDGEPVDSIFRIQAGSFYVERCRTPKTECVETEELGSCISGESLVISPRRNLAETYTHYVNFKAIPQSDVAMSGVIELGIGFYNTTGEFKAIKAESYNIPTGTGEYTFTFELPKLFGVEPSTQLRLRPVASVPDVEVEFVDFVYCVEKTGYVECATVCVNQQIGNSESVYSEVDNNGITTEWWQLAEIDHFTYENAALEVQEVHGGIYPEDLLAIQQEFLRDNNQYTIWYNHKRNCITGARGLKLYYNNDPFGQSDTTVEISLSALRIAATSASKYAVQFTEVVGYEDGLYTSQERVKYIGESGAYYHTLGSKTYTRYGRVETVTDQYGRTYLYAYNTNGTLAAIYAQNLSSPEVVYAYTQDGKQLASQTTYLNGLEQTYTYTTDDASGLVTIETPPVGASTEYTYTEHNTNLASVNRIWENQTNHANVLEYNDEGRLARARFNDVVYTFSNDNVLQDTPAAVCRTIESANGSLQHNTLCVISGQRDFASDLSHTEVLQYGNGYTEWVTYDSYGRPVKWEERPDDNGAVSVVKTCTYGNRQGERQNSDTMPYGDVNSASVLREETVSGNVYKYFYDEDGRLTARSGSYPHLAYEYDSRGRAKKETISTIYNTQCMEIAFDDESVDSNRPSTSRVTLRGEENAVSDIDYDAYGRLSKHDLSAISGGFNLEETYTYQKGKTTENLTGLPVTKLHRVLLGSSLRKKYLDRVSYNTNGQIGGSTTLAGVSTYVYESGHFLSRENQQALGKTYVYEYDEHGNRGSKVTYPLTSGSLAGLEQLEATLYVYDSIYPDRLLGVNGKTCTYDGIGNPTKYLDRPMLWKGTRLEAVSLHETDPVFYTYDANGARRTKTIYSDDAETVVQTITYTYVGNRLIEEVRETPGGETQIIHYLYTAMGLVGFECRMGNGTANTFYYDYDILGNVQALYSTGGSLVCTYVYDAFGNHIVKTAAGAPITAPTFPGVINPIRYKGYYFDTETGYYCIGSRYYDPEVGRFIGAGDVSQLDPYAVCGLNPYLYAENDPVFIRSRSVALGRSCDDAGSFGIENASFVYRSTLNKSASAIVGSNTTNKANGKPRWSFNWPKANVVAMTHHTVSLVEDPALSCFFGNISYTATLQLNPAETFYSFSNIGNDKQSMGVGMNLGNWLGLNTYLSSDWGWGSSWQITPWFAGSHGWSLEDGISYSSGIIIDNTTHEITVSIGNGVLAALTVCVLAAAIPVPGARAAAAAAACCVIVVGLLY